jgi:hypothetical protein
MRQRLLCGIGGAGRGAAGPPPSRLNDMMQAGTDEAVPAGTEIV